MMTPEEDQELVDRLAALPRLAAPEGLRMRVTEALSREDAKPAVARPAWGWLALAAAFILFGLLLALVPSSPWRAPRAAQAAAAPSVAPVDRTLALASEGPSLGQLADEVLAEQRSRQAHRIYKSLEIQGEGLDLALAY
jgi:hypothetical protein